ncbi:GntR family transcriptional regulator [Nocardioides sp.]|uniref:GntR family transcriptional regulator n=1 Tax=Nocardioides sp. TaxID=35761 RepID=UPI003515934E
MPTRPDRRDPLPLWAQVQRDITARIQRGEFDDVFPGELHLVEEYAVSRHTVREALRALRADGLLDAGRGRPTRVAPAPITATQGVLYSLFSAAEDAGHTQRSIVLALDARADGVIARRLGLEESTPLVHLERLRLLDDAPLALDRVWLPARIAAPLLEADFTRTSLYAELDARCGVRLTGGHEQVRAVIAREREQRLLELPVDPADPAGRASVALLHLERVGELRGQPIEWRQTVIRGDRFALDTDLSSPDRITARPVGGSPR